MKNTVLVVPMDDAKKCYVGQFLKLKLYGASDTDGQAVIEMNGHVVRCEQADSQTMVEIQHEG